MDNKEYLEYISKKYEVKPVEALGYRVLDAMIAFASKIENNHIKIKGALSMYLLKNYKRLKITRDIDLAVQNMKVKDAVEELKNIKNVDMYSYRFLKSKELQIATTGYKGTKLTIEYSIFGEMAGKFTIDIAVEEIYDGDNKINVLNVYTLEKTIAEKFVSMIHWGMANGREKDFIDIKALFAKLDKKLLRDLINQFYNIKVNRGVITNDKFTIFKQNYINIEYIKTHKITNEVKRMIEYIR